MIRSEPSARFCIGDAFAMLGVALLVAFAVMYNYALAVSAPGVPTLRVTTADGAIHTYPLDADATYSFASNGHSLTVEVVGGAARVTESDCPDGVCKATPAITKAGGAIICVPARFIAEITSDSGGDADADIIIG